MSTDNPTRPSEAEPLYTPSEMAHAALLDIRTVAQHTGDVPSGQLAQVAALSSIACSAARLGMLLEQLVLEAHDQGQQLRVMVKRLDQLESAVSKAAGER